MNEDLLIIFNFDHIFVFFHAFVFYSLEEDNDVGAKDAEEPEPEVDDKDV